MSAPQPAVHRWPFVVSGASLILVPVVACIYGYVRAFGAIDGESVDPSLKAKMLADGLTLGQNALIAALIAIPLGAAIIIYGTVFYRREKRQLEPSADAAHIS